MAPILALHERHPEGLIRLSNRLILRGPMIQFREPSNSGFVRSGLVLLGIAATFLLASCGNDPNPDPLHTKRPDGTPWTVLYTYMPDEVRSLDPQFAYDEISEYIQEMVQDRLIQYKPMKTDPYEIEPCLLTSLPEKTVNADGTVSYLCHLQSGILFQDDPCFPGGKGRELVAGDVQFAFQRISDPSVLCPVAETFMQHVVGMQETAEAAKAAGHFDYDHNFIRGFKVLDAHTFQLDLLGPYPQILYWMAMSFTEPVAREAVAYYDGKPHPDGPGGRINVRPLFKAHPVGAGPFRIAEHTESQFYRFVRNPNYHTKVFPSEGWPPERDAVNRQLAGHSLPLVDEVQLKVFKEILPGWLLTRQGYLDGMGVMKDAANSAISTSRELAPKYAKRGMRLERVLEPSTFYLVFNMQDPLLGKNKKLRQALSCAYDSQGFVDMMYGGVAPVAQQLLCPGIFGYDKDIRNPYGPNVEKARRLIADAGYPNGIDPATGQPLEISMDVTSTGGEERQLAEYEQRQLEQTGIRVRIIENTFARSQQKEQDGNFQISSSGWGADYPDAENFFFLFYSRNFPPEGANYSRYSNPEYDALFLKMANMENTPERLEIIRKMNSMLVEDCPFVLGFHKGYYMIKQPWAPTTQLNSLLKKGLEYSSIDPVLREKKRREWNPIAIWPIPLAVLGIAAAGLYGMRVNRRRNV